MDISACGPRSKKSYFVIPYWDTVRLNGVKNDARVGAPAPARVTEAQTIRTGKPETASPAVDGPTKDKQVHQTPP